MRNPLTDCNISLLSHTVRSQANKPGQATRRLNLYEQRGSQAEGARGGGQVDRGALAARRVLIKWPRSESVRYKVAILKQSLTRQLPQTAASCFAK